MRLASLTLLALLAGCAAEAPRSPALDEPPTPQHAACQKEADRAPALTELAQQLNMNNVQNQQRIGYEMRVARLRAYRDCLRRNGLAAPGGVESPRPPL